MLSDPVVRKSIYASIIASIIVIIFIQPLLGISADIIAWLGNNLYEGISNGIYSDAALGLGEKYSFQLYMIFLLIIIWFLIIATIVIIKREYIKSVLILEKGINKTLSLLSKIIIILVLIAFIDDFYLISINYASFQMNTSFNQRLTVLAPVLSDSELKQLRARWASMKKRKDYEAIVNDINQIANNKKINLPKLLWE